MSDSLRRGLRLTGVLALAMLVFWADERTAPAVGMGIFYLVPVLVATWYDGVGWGIAFAALTMGLRASVEVARAFEGTHPLVPAWNSLAYVWLVGVAIFFLTRLKRTQDQLRDLATTDALTGVLNPRAFGERLAQELERNRRYGRQLAVLYLDLDDFKAVNDSHGHQTGDAVLRLVADAIRRAVRQVDIIGRLGGDEFAVAMPETDGTLAEAAAARLAGDIRTVFRGTPSVTASIGLVACQGGGPEAAATEEVLRRADEAMYEAKRAGKDRVVQVAL